MWHTRLQIEVQYGAPIGSSRRALRVLPLEIGQTIASESWRASPQPTRFFEKRDRFGNRVLEVFNRKIERVWQFELTFQTLSFAPVSARENENLGAWKMPSRAVFFAPILRDLAADFRAMPSENRPNALCDFVFQNLEYTPQNSPAPARAEEIWARKRGSCADFAHLFLALCRLNGLPARYVAGYLMGEGQMHAWAQVFDAKNQIWRGFDPTHNRATDERYVAVGVGRDFYDVAPHEGTFRGNSGALLRLFCETKSQEIMTRAKK